MGGQHDLWRSIVPSDDVFCKIFALLLRKVPGETEIADLQVTVFVEEDVRRLKIAMYDISRVKILKRSQDLVDEVLHMFGLEQLVRFNDTIKVGFHQFKH